MSWGQSTSPSPVDIGAQPVDSDLTAIAALATTAYGLALLELANQGALKTAVGTALDSTLLAATTPGAGGLAVLDDVSTGAVTATLGVSPLYRAGGMHVPLMLGDTGGHPLVADRLHAVYLGFTLRAVTIKKVRVEIAIAGTGTQTAEVALFSSPAAPAGANQVLTCLVADGTVDSMLSAGVKGNVTVFGAGAGYSVAAGTHLWAGVRASLTGTAPQARRLHTTGLGNSGVTSTAGVLAAGSTYTMVFDNVVSASSNARIYATEWA